MNPAKNFNDVEMVDPRTIIIDENYQRTMDQKRVKRIAENFNENLFGKPLVSRRNGRLYCVDGQHRLSAAITNGIYWVPVEITDQLTQADEALLWGDLDASRKYHSSMEAFRGALVAKRPLQTDIKNIMDELGLIPSLDRNEYNRVGAVGALIQIYHKGGAPLVRDTLMLIKEVWYGYTLAWDKRFLQGVASFLWLYEDRIQWDDVITSFRKAKDENVTPHQILNKTAEAVESRGLASSSRFVDMAGLLKGVLNKYGVHRIKTEKRRDVRRGEYVGFH